MKTNKTLGEFSKCPTSDHLHALLDDLESKEDAPLALTQWERDFLHEMGDKAKDTTWWPSMRQQDKIEEIYDKCWGE